MILRPKSGLAICWLRSPLAPLLRQPTQPPLRLLFDFNLHQNLPPQSYFCVQLALLFRHLRYMYCCFLNCETTKLNEGLGHRNKFSETLCSDLICHGSIHSSSKQLALWRKEHCAIGAHANEMTLWSSQLLSDSHQKRQIDVLRDQSAFQASIRNTTESQRSRKCESHIPHNYEIA